MLAWTVSTPAVVELSVTEQEPVVPTVKHDDALSAPDVRADKREVDLRPFRRVHKPAVPVFTFT